MTVSLAGKFKAQRDEARAENARLRASGNTVDCRSEEGVIVGLIDAAIAQARIVASYLRTGQGEGDTRTDPYYTQLRISGLVDGQVTNP